MKNNKEKLLILSNLYPLPWEPNRATFNKQQFELLKNDYDVHIAVPIAWMDFIKRKDEVINTSYVTYFPYFYTPKKGRRFYPDMMKLSLKFFGDSLLKKFNPDKILASWAFPDAVVGEKIAKDLGIPFYVKVHGSDINGHGDIPSRAKQIVKSLNNSNGVLSVSQALIENMVTMGADRDNLNLIYNGVNKSKFYPVERKQNKEILYVGNLKDTKGVMELIEAFNMIKDSHPDATLKYAGSGHMMTPLNQYALDNDIADRVIFLGPVNHEDIPSLMQSACVVALPSYAEGVPNVLLESMSCGTPVVATNVGGIPEVVLEGQTGYTCNEKSSELFSRLLNDSLLKEWDHDLIVKHAEIFDWSINKSKLLSILSK